MVLGTSIPNYFQDLANEYKTKYESILVHYRILITSGS